MKNSTFDLSKSHLLNDRRRRRCKNIRWIILQHMRIAVAFFV